MSFYKFLLSCLFALSISYPAYCQTHSVNKSQALQQKQQVMQQKVNINTATVEQLKQLPGIGQRKAEAIISYREQHGTFATIQDLGNVKGIGKRMMQRLTNYIIV